MAPKTKTQVVDLNFDNFNPRNDNKSSLLATLVNKDKVKGTYIDLDELHIE